MCQILSYPMGTQALPSGHLRVKGEKKKRVKGEKKSDSYIVVIESEVGSGSQEKLFG